MRYINRFNKQLTYISIQALEIMENAKSNSVYMERIDTLASAKAGPLKHVVDKVNKSQSFMYKMLIVFLHCYSYDGYLM